MKGMFPFTSDHKTAIEDLYNFVRGSRSDASLLDDIGGVEQALNADFVQSAFSTAPFKKINICHFALKHGNPVPTSKLFIRVQQPFVDSDATVAHGLEAWFRRWQGLQHDDDGWDYTGLLRGMIPHRHIEADTGLHSWIAVSVKKGSLQWSHI